jgi:hypothetical protein
MNNFIHNLIGQFPQLAQIDPHIINDTSGWVPTCILARRSGVETINIYVAAHNIAAVMAAGGHEVGVAGDLRLLVDNTTGWLITLDSVSQAELRFYVYPQCITGDAVIDRFRIVPVDPATQSIMNIIGFKWNLETQTMTEYKHYWVQPNSDQIVMQRFNAADHQLIETVTETGSTEVSDEHVASFGLGAVYLPSYVQRTWVQRNDGSNQYLTLYNTL